MCSKTSASDVLPLPTHEKRKARKATRREIQRSVD